MLTERGDRRNMESVVHVVIEGGLTPSGRLFFSFFFPPSPCKQKQTSPSTIKTIPQRNQHQKEPAMARRRKNDLYQRRSHLKRRENRLPRAPRKDDRRPVQQPEWLRELDQQLGIQVRGQSPSAPIRSIEHESFDTMGLDINDTRPDDDWKTDKPLESGSEVENEGMWYFIDLDLKSH
jgi:hypothetical protein